MIAISSGGIAVLVALLAAIQMVSGQGLKIEPEQLDPKEAGSNVNLECTCSECDGLQWHHKGMPLNERIGVVINTMDIDDTWTSMLSLEGVDETYAGEYRCTDPENPFDQVSVSLIVEAAGQGLKIKPEQPDPLEAGSDITLECTCSGCDGLQWHHNDMPLNEGIDVVITDMSTADTWTSMLSLEGVDETSAGQYACTDPDKPLDQVTVSLIVETADAAVENDEPTTEETESGSQAVQAGILFTCSLAYVTLAAILF